MVVDAAAVGAGVDKVEHVILAVLVSHLSALDVAHGQLEVLVWRDLGAGGAVASPGGAGEGEAEKTGRVLDWGVVTAASPQG